MSLHPAVPADVEPESWIDLVEDCREVSGVLAPYVPHAISLPAPREVSVLEIDSAVAAGISGWSDYGA